MFFSSSSPDDCDDMDETDETDTTENTSLLPLIVEEMKVASSDESSASLNTRGESLFLDMSSSEDSGYYTPEELINV